MTCFSSELLNLCSECEESVYSRHRFRERRARIFSPRHTTRQALSPTAYLHQPQAALLATSLAALLAALLAHTMHVRSCAAEREFASATASGAQHPASSAAYTYENTRFRASSSRTASGMMSASAPAYVSMRQHASAHVSIRQHTSASGMTRASAPTPPTHL